MQYLATLMHHSTTPTTVYPLPPPPQPHNILSIPSPTPTTLYPLPPPPQPHNILSIPSPTPTSHYTVIINTQSQNTPILNITPRPLHSTKPQRTTTMLGRLRCTIIHIDPQHRPIPYHPHAPLHGTKPLRATIPTTTTTPTPPITQYQATQSHNEAWQTSLRYRRPPLDTMPGVRRITLNSNPNLGDVGFQHLSESLKDDLWLKGLFLKKIFSLVDLVIYNHITVVI